jgi:hypothetical protein
MSQKQKLLIFSHGFGVDKSSLGMFDQISNCLPKNYLSLQFDYYSITGNTWVVPSIEDMSTMLDSKIESNSDKDITLICHSQGCTVAALSKYRPKKIIFLAPPTRTFNGKVKEKFVARRNDRATINHAGDVILNRRSDDKILHIASAWFDQLGREEAINNMLKLAKSGRLVIIEATQDESIKDRRRYITLEKNGAKMIKIQADHNFNGAARSTLISKINAILTDKE